MGKFNVNNEEKAPSNTKKRGKLFGSRITVWREAFDGTRKALNALLVNFYCKEGKKGGQFLECL